MNLEKLDIRKIIGQPKNSGSDVSRRIYNSLIYPAAERLLYLRKNNSFIENNYYKKNFSFIDEIFDYLDFSYEISVKDREKIPHEGKLICVSNHPLGGLDGLALLKLIKEIRSDVKIVANNILLNLENLRHLFLPYDITNNNIQRDNINAIGEALNNDEAVIIFPSGTVSRPGFKGVKDSAWHKGAVYFAGKFNSPVLPVFITANNSILFYAVSVINKRLSAALLPHELFNKKGRTIKIKIGDHIPSSAFSSPAYRSKYLIKLLRKHTYLVGKNKPGIFKTEKNILHPVDRKILRGQLKACERLGVTSDGKIIYLVAYDEAPDVMKEISRLREVTFRKVGEGTGTKSDKDKYDKTYKHLILWDDAELEIAGAYRLGICGEIIDREGTAGLYTSTLFDFKNSMLDKLYNAVELGRSFVQAGYWNTHALDYLWQGLGAYISRNPQIKYLFGAVSISGSYNSEAKELIVYFYNKWFGSRSGGVSAKNKFVVSKSSASEISSLIKGISYDEDFTALKKRLKFYGCSVPVLYKQYADLCYHGGTSFLDFGIDPGFGGCVDGFILVNIDMIKASKKKRYIPSFRQEEQFAL